MKTSAKNPLPLERSLRKRTGLNIPTSCMIWKASARRFWPKQGGVDQPYRSGSVPDVSDQASAEADQHFSFRIRERERKLLKKSMKQSVG